MTNDPVLVVRQPGRQPLWLLLRSGLVVGRECEGLLLGDAEVSRRHLELRVERGEVICVDLGSTNGSFVEGTRVTEPAVLAEGATVTLGSTTITRARPSEAPGRAQTTTIADGNHERDPTSDPRRTSIDTVADAVNAERWHPGIPGQTVTILFSDIEGSTESASRMGDAAWYGLLDAHNRIFRDELVATGGREIKAQGDGFMLTFPSARRALDYAAAVQRRITTELADTAGGAVRIRIGIHTGEAITDPSGDIFGRHVNKAARIADHATGGQVLISDTTHEIALGTTTTDFSDPIDVDLKGLPGPHRIYEALWKG